MRYERADDIERRMHDIILKLGMNHVQVGNVACIRSHGSSSRRTIARCHALGKVMQKAMDRRAFYVLEFLSERFDRMPEEEKIKVVIHELMHIPVAFGGGFKHHDVVNERNVNKMFERYMGR